MAALTFGPMAVHIGKEIERVREELGMPKTVFAEKIGRTPKNIHEIIERPGIDTVLLRKVSQVLRFNFFRLLSEEYDPAPTGNAVIEPAVQYRRVKPGSPLRMVFEIDPENLTAKRVATEMAEELLIKQRRRKKRS